ncbi:right-handed parallel beta-helix repeat-containing protein [Paenibacillus sp. FSL R5-0475]|uniref:right-handed parallel beta-helix repeat-containing protein n=1 Tax=Paenibacillus sp. FSL R5-0475 TaxID=2921643 RepID=UPI0030F6B553
MITGIRQWLKPFNKVCLSVVLIASLSFPIIMNHSIVMAAGATYYVDTNGSDANDGISLGTPFQTIGRAAQAATAGDSVLIRGGTYRETVIPLHSGTNGSEITYQNYNDEKVIVSGNDVVTGWTQDSGNIYKAPMTWSLEAGNQVFVNGALMDEARWPNQTGTLLNPTTSSAGTFTNVTNIFDTSLPGGNNFWKGATIWTTSGSAWIAQTSTVTGYDSFLKKLTIQPLKGSGTYYDPKSGNRYYLTGIKGALDTAKEWWYDSANGQLYLWAPGGGNPSTLMVEAKRRNNAFDLSGKSYISVKGIQITASTIVTDNFTDHVTIQEIAAKYVSHHNLNTSAGEQANLGIILNGSYNEIRDSEIAYSSGSLVTVKGTNNNIINSYIHDGGYVPNWEGLVNLQGANSLISHNTVSDAGRVTVYFSGGMTANQIQFNNIYNAGWLTTDLGMVYGPNTDGQNTEIHHNFIHDNKAAAANSGIYLDNYTNNFILHHNVVWNNEGIRLNTPSNYNLVYNNTVWSNTSPVGAWGDVFAQDMYGDKIYNNIIKGVDTVTAANAEHGFNLTSSPGFVDEANANYRLLTTSAAKDSGKVIPGITDGYTGNAPDIGAYEYGGEDWTAGHNFASPPSPTYTRPDTTQMNQVVNGGFEWGNLSSWTTTDGGNAAVVADNHWGKAANAGMSRSQFNGVKLSGSVDGIAQTITGLEPDTNYIAGAWLRSPAGENVLLGVTDFGDTEVSASSNSSIWTFVKVKFKTGPSQTSAKIFLKKTSTTGEAYVDDVGLVLDSYYQSMYTFDGFENGLGNWISVPGKGSPSLSSAKAHTGIYSYLVSEDMDAIQQTFHSLQNKVVTMWFYDDAGATNMQVAGFVDNSSAIRGIAVNTPTSTTKYSVRLDGTYTATAISRTTGWHELKWDYTSGTKVDMYIDGVLVASPTGGTNFNRIVIGDSWSGNTTTTYFDDIAIQ